MSNKTLRVARLMDVFDYGTDSDNRVRPLHILNEQIQDGSIRNRQLEDSEITINGNTVRLGGSINLPTGGGGNVTPNNRSRIRISFSPNHVPFVSSDTDIVAVQFSIDAAPSGYTFDQSSVNIDIRDQNHETVPPSNLTYNGNSRIGYFNMRVDAGDEGSVSVVITANINAPENRVYTDTNSASIFVNYQWYSGRRSSAPASVGDLSSNGIWAGNRTFEAPSGTDRLYLALPTRTGGYDMRDGTFRLFIPADGVDFDSNWTLYHTDEAVAGVTYDITEV